MRRCNGSGSSDGDWCSAHDVLLNSKRSIWQTDALRALFRKGLKMPLNTDYRFADGTCMYSFVAYVVDSNKTRTSANDKRTNAHAHRDAGNAGDAGDAGRAVELQGAGV